MQQAVKTVLREDGKVYGAERKAKEDYGLLTTGQRTTKFRKTVDSWQ